MACWDGHAHPSGHDSAAAARGLSGSDGAAPPPPCSAELASRRPGSAAIFVAAAPPETQRDVHVLMARSGIHPSDDWFIVRLFTAEREAARAAGR